MTDSVIALVLSRGEANSGRLLLDLTTPHLAATALLTILYRRF